MATGRDRQPANEDRAQPREPSPGEAAAPRGPHIQDVPPGGMDRLQAANDDGFRAAGRRTRRAATMLSWLAVAAVAGIALVVIIAVL